MMKDSFGKEWYWENEDLLHQFIKANKLQITIEYITERRKLFYTCQVISNPLSRLKRKLILDIKSTKPLSDDTILLRLRSIIRRDKIDKLLE